MIPSHAALPVEMLVIEPPQLRVTVGIYALGVKLGEYEAPLHLSAPSFSAKVSF